MLGPAILTGLSAAGIGFYAWFLRALCKEGRAGLCGYWLRLDLGSDENEQNRHEIEITKRAA